MWARRQISSAKKAISAMETTIQAISDGDKSVLIYVAHIKLRLLTIARHDSTVGQSMDEETSDYLAMALCVTRKGRNAVAHVSPEADALLLHATQPSSIADPELREKVSRAVHAIDHSAFVKERLLENAGREDSSGPPPRSRQKPSRPRSRGKPGRSFSTLVEAPGSEMHSLPTTLRLLTRTGRLPWEAALAPHPGVFRPIAGAAPRAGVDARRTGWEGFRFGLRVARRLWRR